MLLSRTWRAIVSDRRQAVLADVVDEFAIAWQAVAQSRGQAFSLGKIVARGCERSAGARCTAVGSKAHAVQNVLPARGREDLLAAWKIALRRRTVAPQPQEFAQGLGNRSIGAVIAPVRLIALRQHIVQLEEIDHAFPAVGKGVVEAARDNVHVLPRGRKILAQQRRRQFDHDDRRRLERLDESCRQTDRYAVALPECFAITGFEADLPHGWQRRWTAG